MNLSIIIPALEEEKYLPFLLNSIRSQARSNLAFLPERGEAERRVKTKQRFHRLPERGEAERGVEMNEVHRLEIIVADAGSKDKTLPIAKSYGCKVVKGGFPAQGRNEGAKLANGELLLFLDADTILPENSLGKFIKEFQERNLDIAGFLLRPFGKNKFLETLYNLFYNLPILALEKILPHSAGAILVKKSLHRKTGGFDEKIKLAEDHSYSRKAANLGKFGVLRSGKVFYSQRRFKRDGWIGTYFKYLLAELYLIFFGPIKSDTELPKEAKVKKRTKFSSTMLPKEAKVKKRAMGINPHLPPSFIARRTKFSSTIFKYNLKSKRFKE